MWQVGVIATANYAFLNYLVLVLAILLLDDATLHQPSSRRQPARGGPDQWFFRVERQTLRLLPVSRAAVFTIRTYVASVQQLRNEHEDFADNLLAALDSAPSAIKAYKGWEGVADQLRVALARS